MAYVYLLNLYDEIEKRVQEINSQQTGDSVQAGHEQGRLDVLQEFKQFLTDNMNDKLPKRIRKRLSDST